MNPNRRQPLPLALCALAAGSWLTFRLIGMDAARLIAKKFGAILLRASNGKFDDPVLFVHGRLREILTLVTVALALWLMGSATRRILKRTDRSPGARGLQHAAVLFISLNIFVGACGGTVLFWSIFYDKKQVDNFAQYQIKRDLFTELHGRRRAVLIGNSQTNRCIDEVAMNAMVGPQLWTTELTQPGARGFDMLVLSRDIPLKRGDWVICYVTEINFYGMGSGIVAADFLHFGDVPDLAEFHGWNQLAPGSIRSGLLGRVLPLYRYRNSLSHRLLGWEMTRVHQVRHDSAVNPDPEAQARSSASKLGIGKGAEFEQAAFVRMADELSEKGCTLIVIAGNLHPALAKRIAPEVRDNLAGFFKSLKHRHPDHVVIVDGSRFFVPDADSFLDLVHFTDKAQQRFTHDLALHLQPAVASGFPSDLLE
jgi:hypothetical protein